MRWLVLALVVVNAGLYAWNAGWLPRPDPAGGDARPLQRQINPDALRLVPEPVPTAPPAPADAAAPAGVNRPAN
jgi:hypothetical protein